MFQFEVLFQLDYKTMPDPFSKHKTIPLNANASQQVL